MDPNIQKQLRLRTKLFIPRNIFVCICRKIFGSLSLNICKCMHLHIFKRGFSIQSIENFWVKDPKTYYKIYTNAYICIYFSSAEMIFD